MLPLRVLVVDPDERRSTWLADLLSLRGHNPVRVTSGEKAIDLFIQEPADAVMVQLTLPGRDGVATVEAIRWAPKGRDVRVVLLAQEEPAAAPLQMLALKIDAVSAFVGDLSVSQVRRALDDIENRAGHTDSTMAIEDERGLDLQARARRNAPADTVDGRDSGWLEVTTMVAGQYVPSTELNLADHAADAIAKLEDQGRQEAPTSPPPAPLDTSAHSTAPPPAPVSAEPAAVSPPSRPRFDEDAEEDATTFDPVHPTAKPNVRPARPSTARFVSVRASSTFRAPTRTSSSTGMLRAESSEPLREAEGSGSAASAVVESGTHATQLQGPAESSMLPPAIPTDLPLEPSPFDSAGPEEEALVQTDAYAADDDEFPSDDRTQAVPFALPRPLDLVDPLGKTQFAKAPPGNDHLQDPETLSEGKLVRDAAQSEAADWTGSYEETTFPAVLRRIADNRATGALVSTLPRTNADGSVSRRTLDGGAPSKVVYFRSGVPVEVRSNLRDECLGQLLLRKKRITIATLEESIRSQQRDGGFQGEILIAMGALQPIELGETLSEQVRQKLFELFGWRTGAFRFTAGVEPPRGGVAIEMALPEMVYEGVCAAMPATTLRDIMTPRLEYFVVPDAIRLSRFARVNFAKDLRVVLERLDGTMRLREVLSLGQRPGAIAQLVFALESLGAVTYEPSLMLRRVELPPRSVEMPEIARTNSPIEDDAWDDSTVHRTPREAKLGALPSAERETIARKRPSEPEPVAVIASSPVVLGPPVQAETPALDSVPPAVLDANVDRMFDAERLFRKGNRALERGDSLGAIQAFERAVQLCPEEGEFLAYLGWSRHCASPQDGEIAFTAIHELARAVTLAPDLHVAHLLYARVLEHVKRTDDARRGYQQVLSLDPANLEATDALRRLGGR